MDDRANRLEVERLRDLATTLPELVRLLERLEGEGRTLRCADPPLDTATAAGRAAVALLREVAGWGRRGRWVAPGCATATPHSRRGSRRCAGTG